MLTSIVIPTYNKLDYTIECIESIRKYTPQDSYEIIIIDNNSTDGTREWLNNQKDIRAILNDSNLGFPKACNQGIKYAQGENILLLNNDVVVTKRWLNNLLTALYSDPAIGAVGPVTNSAAYYTSIPVSYKDIPEMHEFATHFNISNKVLWEQRLKLIGFCMLIKKEVINKIGYLDEIFTPGNFEDDDYSLRIRMEGYKLLLCKDTFIHHYGSVSWRDNADGYSELLTENEKKFQEKWDTNSSSYIIHNDLVNLINFDKEEKLQILHIGCAAGGTILKMKSIFKNSFFYGVEKNKAAASEASVISELVYSSVSSALKELENKTLDIIMVTDWNYFTELEKEIDGLKNILKPDGLILASVFNASHYSLINSLIIGKNPFIKNKYMSLEDVKKLFKTYKTDIKNVVVHLLEEDKKFIDLYSSLSTNNMSLQYETLKYLIVAQMYDELLKKSVFNLKNEKNVEESLNEINQFHEEDIVEFLHSQDEDEVQWLNKLAIMNFSHNKHDYVLSYLQKAYDIDSKNADTLYNLGLILYSYNEKVLAKKYLEALPFNEIDIEVEQILKEIQLDEVNKKVELVSLLRRIEHDIELEETKKQLVEFISFNGYQEQEIIETVLKQTVNKEKVLNAIAILSFEYNLHDAIFPYLNKAYELNSSNDDTLFNLGFILAEYGDTKSAIFYFEKMTIKDKDVTDILAKLKGDLYE